ncbi:coiled-coil domain-containing protein 134-like [Vespula pensylvanica]|uniref:coiled-coil domain-containing protein 134-like n=1 Tax=Vespula pensylvanica TaxID=30213 RepID=UPI001CB9F361|nr:coiled-coil domain-containing protein 134-like [Vespula pensylvanica]
MQIKLLCVIMYIKFLFLLSIVAHAKGKTSTFKIQPIRINPLKIAIFKIQSNANLLRKSFAKRREEYAEVIKSIHMEDKHDRKLIIIIELIEHIVDSIQDSSTIIDNARSNLNNGTFPKSDSIIEALFVILENVAFFGDIVLHFPDMVPKILRLEKKWREILMLSAQYTDSIQHFVDESTSAVISLAKQELNSLKQKSGSTNYVKSKKNYEKNLSNEKKLKGSTKRIKLEL